MSQSEPIPFSCPACEAEYKIVTVSLFSLSGFWLAFGLGNVSGLLLAYIIWALVTHNGVRPWPKLRRRKRRGVL